MNHYTAAIQPDGDLWIGWIEEIRGVNGQGATEDELLEETQRELGASTAFLNPALEVLQPAHPITPRLDP